MFNKPYENPVTKPPKIKGKKHIPGTSFNNIIDLAPGKADISPRAEHAPSSNMCSSNSILLAMNSKNILQHVKRFTTSISLNFTRPFPPTNEESLVNHLSFFLHSCNDRFDLRRGKQVHAQSIVNGISKNSYLGPKLLGMYVLCDSFMDAKRMFYQTELLLCCEHWNWMIRGLAMRGCFEFALLFYFKMLDCGVCPDKYTFTYVIKSCTGLGSFSSVRLVHDMVRLLGLEEDMFIGCSLIKFYAEGGCIDDARLLFDKMPHRDCVLWNVMLNGYVKDGDYANASRVFLDMRRSGLEPNPVTFAGILSVCALRRMIDLGTQLHCLVICLGLDFDSLVCNTLLAMYSKCRCLYEAHQLFGTMPQTEAVTWNVIISGYVQNGFVNEPLHLFKEMVNREVKPDSVTFASLLPSIAESASVMKGKAVHGYIIRHGILLDLFLKGALIDLYFKCRVVKMAEKLFKQSNVADRAIYSAMISGYVLNGMNLGAVNIFRQLLRKKITPNSVTLASIFPAFAGLTSLKLGKELHGFIIRNRLQCTCYLASAAADMYAKCGRLDLAYRIFQRMPEKDAIFWNTMITSCAMNGRPEEAINLFREMGMAGKKYDCVSISSVLSACASLPGIYQGKEVHGYMIRSSSCYDVYGESALIDMYAKCGNLDTARRVFDTAEEKNEVSWNTLIAAYGSHGLLNESINLFNEMIDASLQPDHVTFLAILSACAHSGRVDDGTCIFHIMTKEYGIPARMEHYACMVDLFGRAGHLDKAFDTIKNMPFSADAGVWGTLLGACRMHGNVDIAEVASRNLLHLDPQNSGYYVLLANVHAGAGHWGDALKVRSMMKEHGVHKVPGQSWIAVDNKTHIFVAAGETHPQSAIIYSMLKVLLMELQREGYKPHSNASAHP